MNSVSLTAWLPDWLLVFSQYVSDSFEKVIVYFSFVFFSRWYNIWVYCAVLYVFYRWFADVFFWDISAVILFFWLCVQDSVQFRSDFYCPSRGSLFCRSGKKQQTQRTGEHGTSQKKMCLFCYKESIQECFRMQDKSKWYKIRRQNHIFAIQKNIVSNWMSGDIQARWWKWDKKLGQDAV